MSGEGILTRHADQPIGGLVLIHGQGDHSRRHLVAIESLAAVGVTVVAPDLPGHGRAEGTRGHIGGIEDADQIIRGAEARIRELVGGSLLINY